MIKKMNALFLLLILLFMVGCTDVEEVAKPEEKLEQKQTNVELVKENTNKLEVEKKEPTKEVGKKEPRVKETTAKPKNDRFPGYKLITVDGGDTSGYRQPKVVVDIGFGNREYWAFTNEHGQLVRVVASKIVLQDDKTEPVTSSGRYYNDEAKVPGVESANLDEGHIIADSLGGVSNAYNITPQNATLNRHGDQAYMEYAIRQAGGATNFEAIITYPNTKTQTPSRYKYTYNLKGNVIVDTFNNVNPDEVNKSLNKPKPQPKPNTNTGSGNLSSVDTNGNGQVTIQEAKAAGFKMPITRDHWLYKYMRDNDHDGLVGE
ncbi:DNA/RNA non-specific endonuclease [Fictibacillus enclensis]|uniref:DNA/RNA non-specific endonuclease n=1 Tax=Fictibacillus enclensis TaxID=1017270 RepID=UPI0025A20C1E|nr:DNA/RNA non-specific endonuclease [Fictibacillus enclensis]MDM5338506.1 DNA/RNA non-specific endonuclease [Fictibacillus enclensis]